MEKEQNYMMYDDDETEIDLKDLMIQIMKHWRRILVFGFLLALALGSFRCYKAYVSYQTELQDEKAKRENSFEVWEYENTKQKLEENIERIDDKMDQIKEYQQNSILMNMEPYDYYWAYSRYFVTTNYKVDPELGLQNTDYTDSVVMAYSSMVVDNALYDEVRGILGVSADDRYVSEVFRFDTDTESDMITIQAVGKTANEAKAVLEAVREKMNASTDKISTDVQEHEIKLISEKNEHINYDDENSVSDIKIKTLKNYYEDRYLELNDMLLEDQKQLVELEKDRPVVEFSISGVIKFAILGFAAGIFLVMMWYAAFYVIGGSVKTEDDLVRRMKLRILGRYSRPFGKGLFIDKKLRHMEGVTEHNDTQEKALKLAAANINALSDEKDKVYLVSTLPEDELKEAHKILSKSVSVKLSYGGNVLASPAAVQALADADKIVLAESLRFSQRVDIEREVAELKSLGKEILGVVLI